VSMLSAAAAGTVLSAGLIVAVGPQNLHVLRTGLTGRYVAATVLLCVAADALLIGLALAGASAALQARPALLAALYLACAPLLLWLAAGAGREALAAPTRSLRNPPEAAATLGKALGRAALVTFANPAVWIETVLIVGATAAARECSTKRAAFGGGALLASTLWFGTLGFGAGRAARWLARPAVLRGLSAVSGLLQACMALSLLQSGGAMLLLSGPDTTAMPA
jgi:L-lysine exporter family protein LysE/ArgO